MICPPESCSWFPFSDEPLVQGVSYAPRFCDPQVLMPEQACDGKWHMFFHSWIGIHHFISDSGIEWEPRKMIEVRGHSPFIYIENEKYYLIYEKHEREIPFVGNKRADGGRETGSRIEMRSSTDLLVWSKPRLILDSRTVPYASDYLKAPRVSRPQLLKTANGYRLYFGASHLILPDTSQKVSRYFGYAESDQLLGPYKLSEKAAPLIQALPDDKWSNLGCGSIRIVPHEDKIYAFQCGVYWDPETAKTHSALTMLRSDDGLSFKRCLDKPILMPSSHGWASSYIMGCDVHYRPEEKNWYCYFSANEEHGKKGILSIYESVGLILGALPVKITGSED